MIAPSSGPFNSSVMSALFSSSCLFCCEDWLTAPSPGRFAYSSLDLPRRYIGGFQTTFSKSMESWASWEHLCLSFAALRLGGESRVYDRKNVGV